MQWLWGVPKGGETAKAFLNKRRRVVLKIAPHRPKKSNSCADKRYSMSSLKALKGLKKGAGWGRVGRLSLRSVTTCTNITHSPLDRSTPSLRLATVNSIQKATKSKSRCSFATSCQSYIQLQQEKSWAVAGLRVRNEVEILTIWKW